MKKLRGISAMTLVILLLWALLPTAVWANAPTFTTTVLFTHDLHSHFMPQALSLIHISEPTRP